MRFALALITATLHAQSIAFPGPGLSITAGGPITLGAHTFVANANGGIPTAYTSSAIDTSGATLIVIGFSEFGLGTDQPVITDSKSNTWGCQTTQPTAISADYRGIICKAESTAGKVGAGHTFTITPGTLSYATAYIAAFNNTKTSSTFDQENGVGAGAGTTLQPGVITPTLDNELVIAVGATDSNTATPTIDSGFTVTDSTTGSFGVSVGGLMAYKVQTTATAVNPTLSVSADKLKVAVIASYKAP